MEVTAFVLRGTLALTLLGAGGAKLADLPALAEMLATLVGAPRRSRLLRPSAVGVSLLELALGLALLSGLAVAAVDASVCTVAAAFTVVVAVGLRRAPGARCRCFGSLSHGRFDSGGLYRAAAVLGAALLLAGIDRAAAVPYPSVGWPGLVVLALGAGFAVAAREAARALDVLERGRT